jgi:ribose transport system substrate-binding protein
VKDKQSRQRRLLPWTGLAVLLLVLSVAVAACGSSSSSSSSSSGGSTAEAGGESTTASAEGGGAGEYCTKAEEDEAPAKFVGPGKPLDPAATKGKSVFWVNFGTTPTGVEIVDGAIEGAKKLGYSIKQFNGNFSVSEWNHGIAQGVAQGADAIAIFAVDSKLVSEGIAEAQEAGIPVIYVLSPNKNEKYGTEDADVSFNFEGAGEQVANYVMCQTEGHVNGHIITDTTYPNSDYIEKGAEPVFEACGESCTVSKSNLPLGEWATKVGPDVKSELLKNPELNVVWPLYDAGTASASEAIGEAGKTEEVNLVSVNGETGVLNLVCNGESNATAAQGTNWFGWAAADAIGRLLAEEEVVEENIPNRLMTKNNLECPVPKAQPEDLMGEVDYKGEYEKLWGLK